MAEDELKICKTATKLKNMGPSVGKIAEAVALTEEEVENRRGF